MKQILILSTLLLLLTNTIFSQEEDKLAFNYRINNLFHSTFKSDNYTQSYFRSMNQLIISKGPISLGTDIWFQHNLESTKSFIEKFLIREMYVDVNFLDEQLDLFVGYGKLKSSLGFYYKPNYAGSTGFFNPWIAYAGPTLTLSPNKIPLSVSLGFDLSDGDTDIHIADYFGIAGLSTDEEEKIFNQTTFEWWGYTDPVGVKIEGNTLLLANHTTFSKLFKASAVIEATEVTDIENTGSVMLSAQILKPLDWIKRIKLETKVFFSEANVHGVKNGLYADVWLTYKNFYTILFAQQDYDQKENFDYAIRIGVNFKN